MMSLSLRLLQMLVSSKKNCTTRFGNYSKVQQSIDDGTLAGPNGHPLHTDVKNLPLSSCLLLKQKLGMENVLFCLHGVQEKLYVNHCQLRLPSASSLLHPADSQTGGSCRHVSLP